MSDRARELLRGVRVAPSILSADFGRLREQVREVLDAGALVIHCDVMDGHFVPPITLGPLVVAALADSVHEAGGVLDVHLMIERPERHVARVRQGRRRLDHLPRRGHPARRLHRQPDPRVRRLCRPRDQPRDRRRRARRGHRAIDIALCMTVNPGWGGQPFIAHSLEKMPRVRALVGADVAVEVDGGIEPLTAPSCLEAGANVFVAGSAIFSAPDPAESYRAIAASVDAADPVSD